MRKINYYRTNILGIETSKGENPCIALYGPGPSDTKCRSCIHLLHVNHNGKMYPKCDLRKITRGAASDHRVNWPSCGRYEQKGSYNG